MIPLNTGEEARLELLDRILALAKKHGATRIVYEGLFTVELPGSYAEALPDALGRAMNAAAGAASQGAQEFAPGDRCACGHSLEIEHMNGGCLAGCPISLCEQTKLPEPAP